MLEAPECLAALVKASLTTFLGQDGGVDATGHLPQLGQRLGQLNPGLLDLADEIAITGRSGALGHCLQAECQRDQPLLGAVMQVPLNAPAGLILGRDDALRRSLQLSRLHRDLVEAVLQLDAEAHVVDDEAGLGDEIVQQPVLGRCQHVSGRFGERDSTP
jgi:hypothetical protein